MMAESMASAIPAVLALLEEKMVAADVEVERLTQRLEEARVKADKLAFAQEALQELQASSDKQYD